MDIIWLILGVGAGSAGMWAFLNFKATGAAANSNFVWPSKGDVPTTSANTTPLGPPALTDETQQNLNDATQSFATP